MKRCKHENVEISEYVTGVVSSRFIDGERESGPYGDADYDGETWAYCSDCGLQRTYKNGAYPAWLVRYFDILYPNGREPEIQLDGL